MSARVRRAQPGRAAAGEPAVAEERRALPTQGGRIIRQIALCRFVAYFVGSEWGWVGSRAFHVEVGMILVGDGQADAAGDLRGPA